MTARTENDLTFVHSSWDDGIEPWRFQLPYDRYSRNPYVAHTVFDRTLLRAGEKISMKHVFRKKTIQGFGFAAKDDMPNHVSISHYGSAEKYEFPLQWSANGTAETVWSIPKEAKLGTYGVALIRKEDTGKGTGLKRMKAVYSSAGEFRVEEFRVPLMKATLQPPGEPLINAREVNVGVGLQYLAGGGAGLAPVKLRSSLGPKAIHAPEAFEHFVFGNGPVEEGLKRRGAPIDDEEGEISEEGEERSGKTKKKGESDLPMVELTLDRMGTGSAKLLPLPQIDTAKEILTELEFGDPNGEIQTVSARFPLWPSKYLVGIKPDSWASAKDNLKFQAAVVDIAGKPVAGAKVQVDLFERKAYSHRKRLVGGFYAYEHNEETRKIGQICTGETDSRGLVFCEGKSPLSGNVVLQAQSADPSGNITYANNTVWVADKSDWWFDVSDNDRIDLLPEKKRYSPGEKAVFQVRMPFRSATVLISVEREGVIESWVRTISGKNPTIEVPIKPSYAPNVFVSALVVRGRVPGIPPTSTVDMGKPAYKLGIAEINVGWMAHELKVEVKASGEVYRVRQKAQVKIRAMTASGKTPPMGSEVAVAAVDEGLLELMPNTSWNILAAMMGRRSYEVGTASAQMQGDRQAPLRVEGPAPRGRRRGRKTDAGTVRYAFALERKSSPRCPGRGQCRDPPERFHHEFPHRGRGYGWGGSVRIGIDIHPDLPGSDDLRRDTSSGKGRG